MIVCALINLDSLFWISLNWIMTWFWMRKIKLLLWLKPYCLLYLKWSWYLVSNSSPIAFEIFWAIWDYIEIWEFDAWIWRFNNSIRSADGTNTNISILWKLKLPGLIDDKFACILEYQLKIIADFSFSFI